MARAPNAAYCIGELPPPMNFMKSNSTHLFSAVVLTACLGAAPALGQAGAAGTERSPATASRSTDQQKLDRADKNFIEKAAESGVKEQRLSQLAAERATNQRVKEYAQQLTRDHQQVNQELVRLAQDKGLELEGDLAHLRSALPRSSTDPRGTSATARTSTGATTSSTSAGAGTAGSAGSPQRQDSMRAGDERMRDRDVRRLSDATGREFDERYVKLMVEEHEKAVKLFEKAAEDAKDPEVRSFASQHVGSLREHLEEARGLERVVAE